MESSTNCFTDRRHRNDGAFTLVELVVTVAISSIVLIAVVALTLFVGRNLASLANYSEMQTTSMNALDRMTLDIRDATSVLSFSSNQLTLKMTANSPLTFTYSPTNRTLTRVRGGTTNVLLRECDLMNFNVYQRTPIDGTFDNNGIADTNEAKVIVLTWNCSRTIGAYKANTEGLQTAKIVLRAN